MKRKCVLGAYSIPIAAAGQIDGAIRKHFVDCDQRASMLKQIDEYYLDAESVCWVWMLSLDAEFICWVYLQGGRAFDWVDASRPLETLRVNELREDALRFALGVHSDGLQNGVTSRGL